MQRLALVTAYKALERSGYVANRTSSTSLSRVIPFYRQSSDEYHESNTAQEVGTYLILRGNRVFGLGRINFFYHFLDLFLIVIPLAHPVWLPSKLLVLRFGVATLTWLSLGGGG